MSTVKSSERNKTEVERCSSCGDTLCKVYEDRGYVFVELKCRGCEKFIIKKFVKNYRETGGQDA